MTSSGVLACAVLLVLLLYPGYGHQNDKTNGEHHHANGIGQKKSCNIYQGRWVYDSTYPLYDPKKCSFLESSFTCQKNGRPDNLYLKYRWQPNTCNLPRFSGRNWLKRFRGKSIMFVGDSLGLNQWQSLICMLHTAVPAAAYTLTRFEGLSIFKFTGYDMSIMLQRNAFLVDLISDKRGRVLNLNSIKIGNTWKRIDTLIFNTWHWWLLTQRQQIWDFVEDANKTYKDMDRLTAYEKALTTWARWVDTNINPTKTRVFFQGVSPDHFRDWTEPSWKTCSGQREPFLGRTDQYRGKPHPAEVVLERVLRKMLIRVNLLNITTLSQLRKDGHPSSYGHGGHRGMDCSHWCLPGVPDTWNHLLYASLFQY